MEAHTLLCKNKGPHALTHTRADKALELFPEQYPALFSFNLLSALLLSLPFVDDLPVQINQFDRVSGLKRGQTKPTVNREGCPLRQAGGRSSFMQRVEFCNQRWWMFRQPVNQEVCVFAQGDNDLTE